MRDERVALLGYDNYASWRLQDRMAKTPEMPSISWKRFGQLRSRVDEEVADMQAIADANGDNISIEPWDYRYYAEKCAKPNMTSILMRLNNTFNWIN
ncbi:MAG: M3 family metallopeptidase [Bacteroidia bacterium]